MTKFGDQIRSVLADTAQFLHITLRTVTLPPHASAHRSSLIGQLASLQADAQLVWELQEDEHSAVSANSSNSQHHESSATRFAATTATNNKSSSELVISACDVHNAARSGYLTKKTVVKRFLPHNKKMWCVVKDGIFYEFEKPTSASQTRSYPLQGLHTRVVQEQKSEFELSNADQKYTYLASDPGDMVLWLSTLNVQVQINPDPRKSIIFESLHSDDSDLGPGHPIGSVGNQESRRPIINEVETFRPADSSDSRSNPVGGTLAYRGQSPPSAGNQPLATTTISARPAFPLPCSTSASTYSIIYETPFHEPQHSDKYPVAVPSKDIPQCQKTPHDSSATVQDEECLYEIINPNAVKAPKVTFRNAGTTSAEISNSAGKAAEGASFQAGLATVLEKSTVPALASCSESAPKKRLSQPGLPVSRPKKKTTPREAEAMQDDVKSNDEVYVALWDCSADAANELSFHAGDRILVLSREYEQFGWWTGELLDGTSNKSVKTSDKDDKDVVGLVPKDYLKQY